MTPKSRPAMNAPAVHKSNAVQSRAREMGIHLDALPHHVAIIMDGNGRWAKAKGLARLLGHREGYRTLRSVLLDASELELQCRRLGILLFLP